MTQDEIIKLAIQANATDIGQGTAFHFYRKELEAFAKLVAAKEHEPVPNLYVKDINGDFHSYKEKGHTENCAAFGDDCCPENHLPPSRFGVGKVDSTAQPKEPEQEPVAYEYGDEIYWHASPELSEYLRQNATPLFRHSPQRTWVGLSAYEMQEIYLQNHEAWQSFACAVEAKLKEKNT